MYDNHEIDVLKRALERLAAANPTLPAFETSVDWQRIDTILARVAERMHNNYPYHHPLYAGQMLKPPHPIARLAYALALWVNPNNHALDGGRASSTMEKELIPRIASMWGWDECLGHLTGGGTTGRCRLTGEAGWSSAAPAQRPPRPGTAGPNDANAAAPRPDGHCRSNIYVWAWHPVH